MKKVAAILLLVFYIVSSSGVAIKAHYCCGQLKSINLVLNSTTTTSKDCKKGCCGDKFAFYKVDDSKNATTVVTFCPSFDKIYYQVSYIVKSCLEPYPTTCLSGQLCEVIPPPHKDINIFIRVLRI